MTPVALHARDLTQILARYRASSPMRSMVELVITAGPLILLWFLMWATLDLGYWLCLLLFPLAVVPLVQSAARLT